MAVHNLKASTSDNEISSTGTTYAAARAGTGSVTLASAAADDTFQGAGQDKVTSTFWEVDEYFASYDTSSVPASGAVVSAHFSLATSASAGASWLLVAREKDFGATVDTGDFVAGASLGALSFLAQAQMSTALPQPRIYGGSTDLVTRMATAGPVKALWHSDRTRLGQAPTGGEAIGFFTADETGSEPLLTVLTVPDTALLRHCGAIVQLSTSDTVYAQSTSTSVAIHLVTSTDDTSIGTATVGTGEQNIADVTALQSIALIADASDNLYLIGPEGSAPTSSLLIRALVKGTGSTWTVNAPVAITVPSYTSARINNVAAAWHDTTGDGHLMIVVSHNAGAGKTGQIAYVTVDASDLLSSAGGITQHKAPVESGTDPTWLGISAQAGPAPYTNSTGTCLDVSANGTVGVVYTIDTPDKTIAGKYTLGTDGKVVAASSAAFTTDSVTVAHDADAKVRVIAIDSSRVACAAAGTVTVRSYAGVILGQADLTAQGLDTFPTATELRGTSTWDVVYDPASNKIWHYYVDTTDTTKVKRTGLDLSTYLGSGEEHAVTTYTASVAGLAAPRVVTDERSVVLKLSGDGEDTVTDSLNVAPNAPTLTTRTTFDATRAAQFVWSFSDANPEDTQSAYQLVINDSLGVSAYDSGKTTSTVSNHTLPASSITNDASWQWKVRVWDESDTVGAYSAIGTFSTTSAGVAAITSPATDNATLKTASVAVTWSVTGATQAQYRVKVVATGTGVTFSDSGFVASATTTTFTITGLVSDTEYRIEVTVKGSGGVESATGTRLVTPSYASPEAPVITAVDSGDGYILITITNPSPLGDEPEVSGNDVFRRKTGDSTWTRIATVERGGSYRDYATASGQSYDYKVTGRV